VTVSAEGGIARVVRGGSLRFSAAVAGNNNPSSTVTWKVSANAAGTEAVTAGTTIASNGTLTVTVTEAAATLYVTATSTVDTTKSGSLAVVIPTVTRVTITPANPQIKRGEGATFAARVQGTGDPGQNVTWKIDGIGGATSATTITANGMLIVSTAETLSQLLVTATSVDDPTKFGTTTVTIPAVPAAVVPVAPPQTQAPAAGGPFDGYTVIGSGIAFTATRNNATVGMANQPIQTVIEGIKADAKGAACQIRFGDGVTPLDTGAASVRFNNAGSAWGAVTLSGKITGNVSEVNAGIIVISGVSITSSADIANTGTSNNSNGIFNNTNSPLGITGGTISTTAGTAVYTSNGAFTITGGTLSATTGYALRCASDGPITISGGTLSVTTGSAISTISGWGVINISGGAISATTGTAVNNRSYGAVNISGGVISATTGTAVYNYATGKVTISGTSRITSANPNAGQGTIDFFNFFANNSTAVRLEITGGTIENTSATGNVINNPSTGGISITGGTILKAGSGGFAINKTGGGMLNATGANIVGRVGP